MNHKDALNLFRTNTYFLPKNIGRPKYLIVKTKIDFDVIDIRESRIMKNKSPINSTSLKDYCHKS